MKSNSFFTLGKDGLQNLDDLPKDALINRIKSLTEQIKSLRQKIRQLEALLKMNF